MLFARIFFFQAEDGIRDLVRSRGLGDVYKRQMGHSSSSGGQFEYDERDPLLEMGEWLVAEGVCKACLLYTSDAADERYSVDLGGRRIIKKKTTMSMTRSSPRDINKSKQ